MGSLGRWRYGQTAPDLTFFPPCPQPSQDLEKVGSSLEHS